MPSGYRCAACGNRTRFDVVSTRRTKAFWHFSLGGEHTIDEEDVLDEHVESVACRWCGSRSAIDTVSAAEGVPISENGDTAKH